MPINEFIYGAVPLQRRVLAFSVATLLYTLVLRRGTPPMPSRQQPQLSYV